MSWRRFFRRKRSDAELQQEIDAYLQEESAENMARGMSPEDARRQARIKLGNPLVIRETLWKQNTIAVLDNFVRDLRYAVRTLSRARGFAVIAVLVMALGMGVNVALFTVVHRILLEPLPYRDSDQLVTVYERDSHRPGPDPFMPVAAGSFAEWQRAAAGTAQMAMVSPWQDYSVSDAGGKLPENIDAAWCSWNFFPVLGIEPALGRGFTPDDDRPNAQATVILTHSLWARRYDSDPTIVGKTIWLNAKPYTIIGVLPASFAYSGAFGGNTLQVWTTVGHEAPPSLLSAVDDHEFLVVARLLPHTTLSRLVDQLAAVQKQIEATHPLPAVHDGVIGRSMLDDAVENYKTPLYALLAASGCVLLIACMNVANLMVARTAARGKDLAVRRALGGSRSRLISERLTESILLSAAGGVGGLLLASGAIQWLVHTRHDMHRIEALQIDGTVAAFTAGVIVMCASFAGLISGIGFGNRDILASLQEGSRMHSGGRSHGGLRRVLLVVEIGLTVVLLIGAGLLLKSYQRLRTTDIGVPADNVLTMHISLPTVRYKEPFQQVAFFEQLIERVRALPRVEAAGLVTTAPGEGWGGDRTMEVVEHPPVSKDDAVDIHVRGAEPGYFAAIHIPLLRGRIFRTDERLSRASVVVISQLAAEKLFPGEDPMGKHIRATNTNQVYEVVGVVGDTRWHIAAAIKPTLYWPIYGNDYSVTTIVVRSANNVESLAVPVQRIIGELDPTLPVSNVMTLQQAIGLSTIDSEFDSTLVLVFAVIALVLVASGLYGVLSYLLTQRTNEIGIRIALGAQPTQLLRLVLIDGLRPALFGLVIGLTASAATVRMIRSMLYETQPLDPAVFVMVSLALLFVACGACLVPAWGASRLDPVRALRTE